jgi:hypothetical protein
MSAIRLPKLAGSDFRGVKMKGCAIRGTSLTAFSALIACAASRTV